ncbi:hypothetical protein [Chitinophaga ginsengisoli]|uniref:Zinc finger protein n=1 Tax=Chitinophaga ginsengisoli TaxID=363837 RepID=A0A2P8GAE3_9BACT|nr:hypothetical protein [Chitinophaga ginsengisoli]PSL30933.1 hypothetical protein CLV42_105294 [Chitinophaga ginsengisoli]
MSQLKEIIYNCKKATSLIERKEIGRLTLRESVELKIHLAFCSVCRIFRRQSITINSMVKMLFNDAQQRQTKLDDTFKKSLQERIEDKLNKNGKKL